MKYWIGAVFFAFGASLIWSAVNQRRKVGMTVAEARAAGLAPPPRNPHLELFGEAMPSIIIGVLVFLGLKSVLVYFAFASQYASIFDLAGFLFVLGSYGFWMSTMTKYRELKVLVAAGVTTATEGEGQTRDERERAGAGGATDHVRSSAGVRDLAAEVAEPPEGRAGGEQAA